MDEIAERFRLKALEWAKLDAAANLLEHTRTIVLSQLKLKMEEKADARAETRARADPTYIEHVKQMVAAKERANEAAVEKEYLRILHWQRQNKDANARHELKMY